MSRQTSAWRGLVIGIIGGLSLGSAAGVADAAGPARKDVPLSDGAKVSRWAYARATTVVRTKPSSKANAVGRLRYLTEDGQPEPYIALSKAYVRSTHETWVKVPLAKRPNGVTGWVPVRSLGSLHVVRGRLVVDRSRLRATLYDADGATIWSARIGVGRRSLATPAGHFYVREKLRAIGSPAYGPFAIGTSAYAPKLSDWPGGGVVGIHGTDEPQLIPGRPSHGCVRLRNADVTRLWHLIAIGTPIDIT
jgi:L,D-transpeptidase catalytic domain